jgi:thioredoxin 1
MNENKFIYRAMSNFQELINHSEEPVLVDFYADWCGPCQYMKPVLQEVAGKLEGQMKVIKVDVDRSPAAGQKYGIRSIPTLILFHKGKILWRQSGAMPENQLIQQVKPFLK